MKKQHLILPEPQLRESYKQALERELASSGLKAKVEFAVVSVVSEDEGHTCDCGGKCDSHEVDTIRGDARVTLEWLRIVKQPQPTQCQDCHIIERLERTLRIISGEEV